MKLIISGKKVLDLGDDLTTKLGPIPKAHWNTVVGKMHWNTKRTEAKIHVEEAMRKFVMNKHYEFIKGSYTSYFDLLSGCGISAGIMSDPGVDLILNDLDDQCNKILAANYPEATLYKEDMFKFPYENKLAADGYFADVSMVDHRDFTLRKYVEGPYTNVAKQLMKHTRKFHILNDCSVFYLNRGAKSFEVYSKLLGETVTNYENYYPALARFWAREFPNWRLIRVEKFYATSFCLFENLQADLGTVMPPLVRHWTSEILETGSVVKVEI